MKKELYPVGSTVHLRGDEAVYWIIIGLVWMVDGGTVSVFMPFEGISSRYWVSAGQHCLVLGGTGSV